MGRFAGSTIGMAGRSGQIPPKSEEYAGTQQEAQALQADPRLTLFEHCGGIG
jgi:hypothetical protein